MSYDPRAVRIKKADKAAAILTYNYERERLFIRELVKVEEKNARTRSARNRGDREEQS